MNMEAARNLALETNDEKYLDIWGKYAAASKINNCVVVMQINHAGTIKSCPADINQHLTFSQTVGRQTVRAFGPR